jgi:hypothetical protein
MSFIDVPNVPGVPALSSYAASGITQVFADAAAAVFSTIFGIEWGIFLIALPVLSYDNQIFFGYQQEWVISDYPVEAGSFQSYDKVQKPATVRVRIAAGGSTLNRFAMLESIALQMSTTLLYNIVTPEAVYLNFCFEREEYVREADNVGLIAVDLIFREVLQSATASFQNTATPTIAGAQGAGNVSTTTPTDAQTAAISDGL